jgi:hypothetical protein
LVSGDRGPSTGTRSETAASAQRSVCGRCVQTPGLDGGCRIKPSGKTRSALAEVHARAVVGGDLASDRPLATAEMAVFGAAHKGSSELAGGLCDSLREKQQAAATRLGVALLPVSGSALLSLETVDRRSSHRAAVGSAG